MSNQFHESRRDVNHSEPEQADGARAQRGIQSVEVGGQLLLALAHAGRPMALKDLAREAGMAPAKAHPYLVSFGKLGLIEQDADSGRYGLGPLALQLGLISLQQFDPVRLATPRIAELAPQIGHTVALAVWGNRGPTIVRVEEAPSAIYVNMRHGTVMSMRGTASGRLFAAYLPRERVLAALAAEAAHGQALGANPQGAPTLDAAFQRELDEVRARGLSQLVDGAVPGISALAVPVFDASGALVLGLTTIGPTATLDVSDAGALVQALRRTAAGLSQQLGARLPDAV
jgi:DNA-binding IclR family transcriptional regulator